MQEIFNNISDEVKNVARTTWNIALTQPNPILAAEFLKSAADEYSKIYSEEEMQFFDFYFNLQFLLYEYIIEEQRYD